MPYRQPQPRIPQTIVFTAAENAFLNSIKPWEPKHWSESFGTVANRRDRNILKQKIKTDLLGIQGNYCAFCGLNLNLAHEVHREHIAPQYKQPEYIFEPRNIVLSCNFCNMHKKKKLTMSSNTGTYSTETFFILHPYNDDFSTHLSCNFHRNDLVFTILNTAGGKTQATIDCVGLAEPHLMAQRGAIILRAAMPKNAIMDGLVDLIIKFQRFRK